MASNLNIMAASSDSTEVMSVTKGSEVSTDTTNAGGGGGSGSKGYSLGGSGGLQGFAFQAANLSLVGYFMMIFTTNWTFIINLFFKSWHCFKECLNLCKLIFFK